jgi:hypothetical protein
LLVQLKEAHNNEGALRESKALSTRLSTYQ